MQNIELSELPITKKKKEFLRLLEQNQVVIVVGETGSGKSTQVPQYILESGRSVLVTEPRRLAAVSLAHRVASEMGMELGDVVGYSVARDKNYTSDTTCLFATDGLALVRELLGNNDVFEVLVIDEIHEWNLNQETLVAYVKNMLANNSSLKIVIMSATMESEKLSAFFGGAPILNVEGRMYPVERVSPQRDIIGEAAFRLKQGHNVLVFQPGKKEIADFIHDLNEYLPRLGASAEVLPLHGELEWQEQQNCFKSYARPKCVVSTNVAQTSVTIPDIDVVIDSGMEKRVELAHGVETLMLRPISFKDSEQRAGRAGRCKPGVYIDFCPEVEREEFPVAEMLRFRLDQVVLRLMAAGFDPEELEFFHQPDKEAIRGAKVALRALGCIDKNGYVTEVGDQVSTMPVSVKAGKMLVEAHRRGVVWEVMIIASIIEAGGIIDRDGPWRKHIVDEDQSDLLGQLQLWNKVWNKPPDVVRNHGVHTKSFRRARDTYESILEAVRHMGMKINSTGNREDILKSVCAGLVEHCYRRQFSLLKNGDSIARQLDFNSIIRYGEEWIVGFPLDITTRRGQLHLVKMATCVKLEWLMEVAPQLLRFENGINPYYDHSQKMVKSTNRVYFASHLVEENIVDSPNHPRAKEITAHGLNENMWRTWLWTKAPHIHIPIPRIESEDQFPSIRVEEYGTCATTGVKLVAYGAVTPREGYTYTQKFQVTWSTDKEKLESSYREALELFTQERKAYLESEAQRKVLAQTDPVMEKVSQLFYAHQHSTLLETSLRDRLRDIYEVVCFIPSCDWVDRIQEFKALCDEVEQAVIKAERSVLVNLPTRSPGEKMQVIKGGFAAL